VPFEEHESTSAIANTTLSAPAAIRILFFI
jgi:hypothetical protein